MQYAFALVLALCLTSCSEQDLLHRLSSPEAEAYLETQVTRLRARQFDAIEKEADSTIRTDELRPILEQMAAALPGEDPVSKKLVGANKTISTESTVISTTMEYAYRERWVLVNLVSRETGGVRTIVEMHVVPQTQSIEAMSAFTLRGKSLLHYAVLAGALCTLTVTLVALVVCIRTRMKRAKWRWILFILVGIGNFSVNWFTGEWTFAPLSILLFSAGAVGQLYMPWIVSVAAPVGAILFLARRKALAASASEG